MGGGGYGNRMPSGNMGGNGMGGYGMNHGNMMPNQMMGGGYGGYGGNNYPTSYPQQYGGQNAGYGLLLPGCHDNLIQTCLLLGNYPYAQGNMGGGMQGQGMGPGYGGMGNQGNMGMTSSLRDLLFLIIYF